MKHLDEIKALAIVFGNTRRKKRKEDLVTIAKAVEYLAKVYKSQKAVAEKVGLSQEMIRQFLTVLKLPMEIQELFSERKIDSVDIAKQLVALKDEKKQVVVARKIVGLLTKESRDIQRLIKRDRVPVKEAKKIILEAKTKGLHIFMLDFNDEIYKKISIEAKKAGKGQAELVREIVVRWLAKRK